MIQLLQCDQQNAHTSLQLQYYFNVPELLHVSALTGPSSGGVRLYKTVSNVWNCRKFFMYDDRTTVPLDDFTTVPLDLTTVPLDDFTTLPLDYVTTVPLDDFTTIPLDLTTVPLDDFTTVPFTDLTTVPLDDFTTVPLDELTTVPHLVYDL